MKKILIFGGAFDPPHIGHLLILKNSIKKIKPDKVIIVVDSISPWKNNSIIEPYNFRKQMIKNLFDNQFKYSFYNNKEKNFVYSVDVIKDIHSNFKNDELYFLLGQDQYVQFSKWNDYKKIDEIATIICHYRFDKKIKKINDKHIIISNNTINISSTELKSKLDKKMLGNTNYNYIIKNNLYLLNKIKPLISESRFKHTLSVLDAAILIASGNNASAKTIEQCKQAAILHDVCKEFSIQQLKNFMTKKECMHLPSIHCAHGIVAARWLKEKWNFNDEIVLSAIANHVIPTKKMSFVAKVLFCADKLENNRTNKDILNRKKLLKISINNLNKGFDLVCELNQQKYLGEKQC